MNPAWILIPLIATLAGGLAVRGLIWLLFHPVRSINLFGFRWQGLLPAKQAQLALKMGNLVASEFGTASNLGRQIADPDNFRRIMPLVEEQVDQFLRVRLVEKMPMIGMLIGDKTIGELKTIFMEELESLFPIIMEHYLNSLQSDNGLEMAVVQKIADTSIEKWEKLLRSALSKELLALQIAGAVFGALVGLIQLFALLLA